MTAGRIAETPQVLDPLGGVTAQTFAWALTIAAFATTAIMSFLHLEDYRSPVLVYAAILAVAAGGVVLVMASSPLRLPFGRTSAALVDGLALLAYVCDMGAQWGTNSASRTDWSPVVIVLFLLATASFRPASQIMLSGGISTLVVGLVATVVADSSGWPLSPVTHGAIVAAPVLVATLSAAAYSAALVIRLRRWRDATEVQRAEATHALRERVRDEVRGERLALIEAEVAPFLRQIASRGATTADDAAQAAQLADDLRRALLAETDDVWLGGLVAHIHDPDALAADMNAAQRDVIEAVCARLWGAQIAATVERVGANAVATLRWDAGARSRLGPDVQAVLRQAFPGARIQPWRRLVRVSFAIRTA